MALARRAQIKQLPVEAVKIPEVRVTSYFSEEIEELFKESVREAGIVEPILVAYDGQEYVLIDGLHRLQEAKLNNQKRIQAAVIEADYKTVLLQNLVLNRLRGKAKPSEMVKVIGHLRRELGMAIEEICLKTGLRRDYVEKMLKISEATEELQAALDDDAIGVGTAYEIARVEDPEMQKIFLAQALKFNLKPKDMRDIIEDAMRMVRERRERAEQREEKAVPVIRTVKCEFCKQPWPPQRMAGVNVCPACWSIAGEAVAGKLQEIADQAKRELDTYKLRVAEAAGVQPETLHEEE